MRKQLSELSKEELWDFFPLALKEYNPYYKAWYRIEKKSILEKIKTDYISRINHIGSSAVEDLLAKPIIDILLEIDGCCNLAQLIIDLQAIGWELNERRNDPMSLMFIKGYTPDGFADRVYHLHVRYLGNWNELYFRDYLMEHVEVAKEYSNLKVRLINDFKNDRNKYTDEKSEFVLKYSTIARREFHDKYKPRV